MAAHALKFDLGRRSRQKIVLMKKYFWDFFGPTAQGTAEHFVRHLQQFLNTHQLTGCSTGVESAAPNHFGAYCIVPEIHEEAIKRGLRPQRVTESAAAKSADQSSEK